MSKLPPKASGGYKLSQQARQWQGTNRTCVSCGDTKVVDVKTYAPSKDGKGGWAEVCRVCQGTEAAMAGNINVTSDRPKPVKLAPSDQLDAMIEEMYLEAGKRKPDFERIEEIKLYLESELKRLPDEESFRLFIRVLKPCLGDGWKEPGTIHDDIIKGLMSPHHKRLIIATRYSAKSTITSWWVTWRLWKDPYLRILVISARSDLAKRMLNTIRKVYLANCPLLEHLVPNEDCLDNADQFQTPQAITLTTGGVSFTSHGITSNITGLRADLVIGDDVEAPDVNTPEKVEDLMERITEFSMIAAKGHQVLLGTYQSEFSLYARLLDMDDLDGKPVWENHRACMFEEDTIDGQKVYASRWPAMFSDDDARRLRGEMSERLWKLHMMLVADPSILNDRPLKISLLPVIDHDPISLKGPAKIEGQPLKARPELNTWGAPKGDEWWGIDMADQALEPYQATVMAVDPASGMAGRDAIGVAILGILPSGHGVIRWLEGVRGPDKMKNIRRCAELVKKFGVTALYVEELADGLFGETLEQQNVLLGNPMAVNKVTTGGVQKGRRIVETLQPPMANGRLLILKDVCQSEFGADFVHQLVRITYDGRTGKAKDHDDIVDALAHAVASQKGVLVSDVADNRSMLAAQKVEHWRGMSRRFGFGSSRDQADGYGAVFVGNAGEKGGDIGERLFEEDQVLIAMEERLRALQDVLETDRALGRTPDQDIVERIQRLDKQVRQLKGHQLL